MFAFPTSKLRNKMYRKKFQATFIEWCKHDDRALNFPGPVGDEVTGEEIGQIGARKA